ncbi:hypothetical protein CQA49_00890 [Helicobacter sp. MIT 00-7814]|uniref:hypothetical protein n=1 Tax=unclassified Helicobacter TaxID=2593540 RepID=UPI000E1F63FD|nr:MULTISPECIES: hypothetical protein [unclassified Helicobacter]RDU55069.1 hypothetical protein CQA37_04480 [Helicobacter sp. MIT 99-10781]RDU56888.1 hypothetical protein CQA49_00890 [Helicobacter sp. MIT 00-7814]
MRVFLSILCVGIFSLCMADDASVKKGILEEYYFTSLPDNANKTFKKTPLYNKAIELYTDKKQYKKEKLGKALVGFPDFKQIRLLFIQSYLEEKNVAGLTSAAYFFETFEDMRSLKTQIDYFSVVTALAKEGNCKGFLESAKYFIYGKGDIAVDKKQGKSILLAGKKKCTQSIYAYQILNELNKLTAEEQAQSKNKKAKK